MKPVVVAFGSCELDGNRLELRRDGVVVPIEPQVFEVLAYLVEHHDRVVPKTELLDEVWGSRFVSESALTSRIKSARRAVGDTGRDQRMIRTVYGRGYRFVADVEDRDRAAATDEPRQERTANDRVDAHQRVLAAVDAVVAGRGGAVAVEGRLGSGKTDLLHRAAEAASAADLVVGRGSAAGLLARPFHCVVEALDEMAQRRPEVLDGIPASCRAELERVFAGELPSTRQRLFVAAREALVALARDGAVLVLDDVDEADPETLALIDEAVRLARRHRLLVVAAWRSGARPAAGFDVVDMGSAHVPSADRHPEDTLPRHALDALRRVALAGPHFDLLELRAATGTDEPQARRLVDTTIAAGVLEAVSDGFRFVDNATVDRLVAGLERDAINAAHRETASALIALGAPPESVAAHLLAAGERVAAAPHAVAAARRAAAAGLHTDVLRWTGAVRDTVEGDDESILLALRADSLTAVGDETAVAAYREALRKSSPADVPRLRAGLARAAIFSGDLASAEEALAGMEPDGGPSDGAILLTRGMLAYFMGDLDAAESAMEAARGLALAPGAPDRLLDVITLQGMIAHNRGAWFDRMRRELRASRENPGLATAVFDSHVCVAEFLLYGPTPYREVIDLAGQLRQQAERSGTRRAVAFAVALAGEAALLAGDLELARRDLTEAVSLHQEMGAETGTAHALQRLAEVELAAGNVHEAERLLRRALPLARWSPLSRHLLQRIYGTLIAAVPDVESALAVVAEAEDTMDEPSACPFCHVMFAVPAAIACAEGGRLDDARRFVVEAELSAALWQGTAWQGAVTEAKAHVARAEGRPVDADRLLAEAAELFGIAGQPLDVQRCTDARTGT